MKASNYYPSDVPDKLGLDEVKKLVARHAKNYLGKLQLVNLKLRTELPPLQEHYATLRTLKGFIEEKGSINSYLFMEDLREAQALLKVLDQLVEVEDLFHYKTLFRNALDLNNKMQSWEEELGPLECVLEGLCLFPNILNKLESTFDEEGNVLPSASPGLAKALSTIASLEKKLRKSTESILSKAKESGFAADGEASIRNGRPVLPILPMHKKSVPGILHDRSGGGKILYIEPLELVEAGNALQEALMERDYELLQIRKDLCNLLHHRHRQIESTINTLGYFDALNSLLLFSKEIDAIIPSIMLKEPYLKWRNACHPLLCYQYQGTKNKVIPLHIKLTKDNRILLISGPNAGGKSIALKTVGLIQLMFQTGIPVPLSPDSHLGVFEQFFVDIGDEQSIEANLSTYSSHLRNMDYFVKNGNASSLYLIDEFGTGTDPALGGAMAESLLEAFISSEGFGVITTHYGNLKNFAAANKGIVNGAMLFEPEKLRPLFTLEMDKPGSSFTFEVAEKMGLDVEIIEKARSKLSRRERETEDLLVELENIKATLSRTQSEIQHKEVRLATLLKEYESLKEELVNNKKKILNKAKLEAEQLLNETNKKIENTIKTIVESKASKAKVKRVRKELSVQKSKLKPEKLKLASNLKPLDRPEIGQEVFLETNPDYAGKILKIKGQDIQVAFGILQSWMRKEQLFVKL